MGSTAAKAVCDCDGTKGTPSLPAPQPQQECCASSKKALPSCTPVITAAVKSTCRTKRLFLGIIVLLLALALIYWISEPNQQISFTQESNRNQRSEPRSPTPPVPPPPSVIESENTEDITTE